MQADEIGGTRFTMGYGISYPLPRLRGGLEGRARSVPWLEGRADVVIRARRSVTFSA